MAGRLCTALVAANRKAHVGPAGQRYTHPQCWLLFWSGGSWPGGGTSRVVGSPRTTTAARTCSRKRHDMHMKCNHLELAEAMGIQTLQATQYCALKALRTAKVSWSGVSGRTASDSRAASRPPGGAGLLGCRASTQAGSGPLGSSQLLRCSCSRWAAPSQPLLPPSWPASPSSPSLPSSSEEDSSSPSPSPAASSSASAFSLPCCSPKSPSDGSWLAPASGCAPPSSAARLPSDCRQGWGGVGARHGELGSTTTAAPRAFQLTSCVSVLGLDPFAPAGPGCVEVYGIWASAWMVAA